jgi:NAD(P)-dependent dehydrogenase (short-subunit alcohol dehydrogenase family)
MSLAGKTVLVTGASGGIGKSICRTLAERGASVVLQYRTGREKAEALAAELPAASAQHHRTVAADLTDPASVETLVEEAISAGRLDILVNNAGIFERHPPLAVDYESWQHHWKKTLGVNLVGPANVSWCAGRHMAKAGGGRIINITSRGAFRGEPESPAYGASKAGLNSLSQSLAVALAPHGIFVFAIAPGFVETAMVRDYITGELAESIRRQSPLHRVARPEDVAYWVGCMAEDDASFATGTILDVNGASYLRS